MKRILTTLAVVASASVLAAPAHATTLLSDTFHDAHGDARPAADIWRTTVTHTDQAIWTSTRIADLKSSGRYHLYLYDRGGASLVFIVNKRAGEPPVTGLWSYADDGTATREPCTGQVRWNASTNVLTAQLPYRCDGYLDASLDAEGMWPHRASFSYGTTTDRIGLP